MREPPYGNRIEGVARAVIWCEGRKIGASLFQCEDRTGSASRHNWLGSLDACESYFRQGFDSGRHEPKLGVRIENRVRAVAHAKGAMIECEPDMGQGIVRRAREPKAY